MKVVLVTYSAYSLFRISPEYAKTKVLRLNFLSLTFLGLKVCKLKANNESTRVLQSSFHSNVGWLYNYHFSGKSYFTLKVAVVFQIIDYRISYIPHSHTHTHTHTHEMENFPSMHVSDGSRCTPAVPIIPVKSTEKLCLFSCHANTGRGSFSSNRSCFHLFYHLEEGDMHFSRCV